MFIWISSRGDVTDLCYEGMETVYQSVSPHQKYIRFYAKTAFNALEDSFCEVMPEALCYFRGILVNSSAQLGLYKSSDIPSLIRTALSAGQQQMFAGFHGQFCGIAYTAQGDTLTAATNVANTMRIYYYQDPDTVIVATSIKLITLALRHLGKKLALDEVGARMILSYGFTLADYTTICGVKHLGAGNCLQVVGDKVSVISYQKYNNEPLHHNEGEAVEELERLFLRSVQAGYEKDLEKGRKHIAFLSGGLDSRIGMWAAYKQGYRDIECLNFSQPGYADEVIARRICKDLGLPLRFFSLANGDYLLHLEENLVYNDGQIILHGSAHLFRAIQELDLDSYGILHSGQIGDLILGSNLDRITPKAVDMNGGAYSLRLLDSIRAEVEKVGELYSNHEIYTMYNRCFNAAINGDYASATFSQSVSPFMDPEFAQYGMNISAKLRYHNKLYISWFQRHYPQAARYTWEKSGSNLYTPELIKILRILAIRGSGKLYRLIAHKPPSRSMNPFDLWWSQNSDLRAKFGHQSEFMDTIAEWISTELRKDIVYLLESGNFSEVLQVYTLLQGIKYLLPE